MKRVTAVYCVAVMAGLFGSVAAYATGTISGTVTDTGSQAIGMADVIVMIDSQAVAGAVASANGVYSLSGLEAGTYEVQVLANGYEYASDTTVVVIDSQVTTKNFTLAVEGKISGTISSLNGRIVKVIAESASGLTLSDLTDSVGDYQILNLPAGTYTVTTEPTDNDACPSSSSQVVTSGSSVDVDLTAQHGKISGTITFDGNPLANNSILVKNSDGDLLHVDMTESNGTYETLALVSGTYTIEVVLNTTLITASNSIAVNNPSTTTFNYTVPTVSISGTITDTGSNAIYNAKVEAACGRNSYEAFSDTSGHYSFTGLQGEYSIVVKATGYAVTAVYGVTALEDITDQDFSLPTGGKISGTITDSSNNPIAGATVFVALNSPDISHPPVETTTDSQGDYLVDYLLPGTHSLMVSADNYVPTEDLSISVTAGQTTTGADFSLSNTGATISGTVEDDNSDPIEGATVCCINSVTMVTQTATTNANGQYSLALLAPGTYGIVAVKEGYDFATTSDVTITGTEVNSGNDIVMSVSE